MALKPVIYTCLFSFFLFFLATTARSQATNQIQTQDDAPLARVKAAINKAGKMDAGATASLPYTEIDMATILCAAEDCIAQPMARALKAKLQFKPRYRDAANYTRTIRRPASSDSRHHRLGFETVTVEVKHDDDSKTIESYDISGGDAEALRQIGPTCFFLQQAFKDTPLDSSAVRYNCPALKSLHTLLVQLPRYAERYLELAGIAPRMFEVRLQEIETKRKELLQVQADWMAEMAHWRKLLKDSLNKKPQAQN